MSGARTKKTYHPHRGSRRPVSSCEFSAEDGRALAGRDMDSTHYRRSYRRCRRDHYPTLAKSRRMVRRRK